MKMNITGETTSDVKLKVPHNNSFTTWNLGKCIIVQNLGVDILIGEPAKVDNEIVTIPHKKTIEANDENGNRISIPSLISSHGTRHQSALIFLNSWEHEEKT